MRRTARWSVIVMVGVGSAVFQGCPLGGLLQGFLSDCFGGDTISRSEYEDLNVLERLMYEENDCGRYERHSSILDIIP